jgi:large subunit ribosomal protein L10
MGFAFRLRLAARPLGTIAKERRKCMPSAEHLRQKQAVIDEIKANLEQSQSAIVIDYIGISVAEADAMRKRLREENVRYKIYKNTLVERAIEGTAYSELKKALAGPSAFAFGIDDAVAPARILSGIFKEFKKMEFKAGIIEGTFFDAEGMKQIASLPTRDELIGRFMGSIQSPVSKLVRTFKAIADEMESGNGGAAEASAESAPSGEAAEPSPEPAAEAAAESGTPTEAAPAEAAVTEAPAETAAAAETVEAAPAEAPAPSEEVAEKEAAAAPAEEE